VFSGLVYQVVDSLTADFHGINVATVLGKMEEKASIAVAALDETVGMLKRKQDNINSL
jgi:hypothetical protein